MTRRGGAMAMGMKVPGLCLFNFVSLLPTVMLRLVTPPVWVEGINILLYKPLCWFSVTHNKLLQASDLET